MAIINSAKYQRADQLFHGVLSNMALELSQPTKVVVADVDDVVDVLFHGLLRVEQHSQNTDNVD